eukprot:COSAG02_NODE_2790_length_8022_cov_52.613783_6_plen_178_part_00
MHGACACVRRVGIASSRVPERRGVHSGRRVLVSARCSVCSPLRIRSIQRAVLHRGRRRQGSTDSAAGSLSRDDVCLHSAEMSRTVERCTTHNCGTLLHPPGAEQQHAPSACPTTRTDGRARPSLARVSSEVSSEAAAIHPNDRFAFVPSYDVRSGSAGARLAAAEPGAEQRELHPGE